MHSTSMKIAALTISSSWYNLILVTYLIYIFLHYKEGAWKTYSVLLITDTQKHWKLVLLNVL